MSKENQTPGNRKVWTRAMARTTRNAMQDLYHFEAVDTDDAQQVLAAVAPAIAEKALLDFADYLRDTGAAVGIRPDLLVPLLKITRRYAQDLPKPPSDADKLVAALEQLHVRLQDLVYTVDGAPAGLEDQAEEALNMARRLQEDEL